MTAVAITQAGRFRRRRTTNQPSKKVTFQISESLMNDVRELVDAHVIPSASALVEDALVRAVRELRRQQLYASYAEAAQDSVFLDELSATTAAFEHTVSDGISQSPTAR